MVLNIKTQKRVDSSNLYLSLSHHAYTHTSVAYLVVPPKNQGFFGPTFICFCICSLDYKNIFSLNFRKINLTLLNYYFFLGGGGLSFNEIDENLGVKWLQKYFSEMMVKSSSGGKNAS